MLAQPTSLTVQEALSGIAGSISLASWVFLLVPQLIENYKQGSAAGISLLFLVVWMIGDITNLAGAVWAGLVPTVIALAVYFCFADTVLILQCLYYNKLNASDEKNHGVVQTDGSTSEEDPLLPRRRSSNGATSGSLAMPGSRRKSSATSRGSRPSQGRRDSLSRILEETSTTRVWLKNIVSVLLIICAGTAGWAVAWKAGAWKPTPISNPSEGDTMPFGASILGYASAVLYLGARLPQIAKNYREK